MRSADGSSASVYDSDNLSSKSDSLIDDAVSDFDQLTENGDTSICLHSISEADLDDDDDNSGSISSYSSKYTTKVRPVNLAFVHFK